MFLALLVLVYLVPICKNFNDMFIRFGIITLLSCDQRTDKKPDGHLTTALSVQCIAR